MFQNIFDDKIFDNEYAPIILGVIAILVLLCPLLVWRAWHGIVVLGVMGIFLVLLWCIGRMAMTAPPHVATPLDGETVHTAS
jgi:hypothetical protein